MKRTINLTKRMNKADRLETWVTTCSYCKKRVVNGWFASVTLKQPGYQSEVNGSPICDDCIKEHYKSLTPESKLKIIYIKQEVLMDSIKITVEANGKNWGSETAQLREFKSGKTGFGFYGKVTNPNGKTPDAITLKIEDKAGNTIVETSAPRREFKSGKKGYGYYNKVVIGEDRHQCSCNIVQVGSEKDETDPRYQCSINIVKLDK